MVVNTFDWLDYVLFALVLLISLLVGVYYSCTGGKQKTTKEYLLGGGNLRPLPVAASMFMSYISAVLVLGNTAEMYTAGVQYWLAAFGSCFAFFVSAIIFVPFFYKLKLTSSFEYFDMRFKSKLVKLWATVMFLISSIVYMGLTMYTPSIALEAVTGFPVWGSILASGGIATIYTTLGGMKAVVWTDTIQGVIMVAGILTVLILGTIKVGGLDDVFSIAKDGGRLVLFDFNPDPTIRLTFWSVIFGRFFISLNMVGTGQTSIQRYSSLSSLRDAQISCLLNCPAIILVYTLTCLLGLVVYAYYEQKGCDPLANGEISSSNQLLPFFIMEVINYPGIPGVFLASLFSGALSSLSSSLNSMAACTWKDMLEWKYEHWTESSKALLNKSLVVVYGVLGICSAFSAKYLGGHVLQATNSLVGGIGGPSLGMFIIASFFPWTNWQGAFFGSLIGFGMASWISVGAYVTKPSFGVLPTTTENCYNISDVVTSSSCYDCLTTDAISNNDDIFVLYKTSYMYSAAIGCLVTVVSGLLISMITGPMEAKETDARLLNPIVERICCCLPKSWKYFCQCGVDYDAENEDGSQDGAKFEDDTERRIIFQNKGYLTSQDQGISGTYAAISPDHG